MDAFDKLKIEEKSTDFPSEETIEEVVNFAKGFYKILLGKIKNFTDIDEALAIAKINSKYIEILDSELEKFFNEYEVEEE